MLPTLAGTLGSFVLTALTGTVAELWPRTLVRLDVAIDGFITTLVVCGPILIVPLCCGILTILATPCGSLLPPLFR